MGRIMNNQKQTPADLKGYDGRQERVKMAWHIVKREWEIGYNDGVKLATADDHTAFYQWLIDRHNELFEVT